MYMYVYQCTSILTQVYAQNDQLRTQLEQSKRIEKLLREQINKAEQKVSDLLERYDKQNTGEDIESQLKMMQRKMLDVKNEFGSIDVIKQHWTGEVSM